ncbi:protein particle complex subunit 1 [Seminavis robusta]|uniref:Trafficking protein particle complex subunit n=1 Tax=Seminavis robusta TaxID=568900 RepID=A0A9N8DMF9_9STRA|nr:protein particle complex subunit 1 [Seminavis robusta]|eukprot:Sro160_g072070.1 protein particle complex subunit 1 (153) ;mRNA; f:24599-25057
MGVHSFLVFDRKGKTMFAKRYGKADAESISDEAQLEEQRKLVFGMLFSLREVIASLSPSEETALHTVQTGASTIHNYETNSGMRVAVYMTPNPMAPPSEGDTICKSLEHIYKELWVQCVIRSPLYRPTEGNINATNFEQKLDDYLVAQPWFR